MLLLVFDSVFVAVIVTLPKIEALILSCNLEKSGTGIQPVLLAEVCGKKKSVGYETGTG